MKTAIYIEDDTTQLVITPEHESEKEMLRAFRDKLSTVQVFEGSFYDCRGGWIRQSAYNPDRQDFGYGNRDYSLIMRVSESSQDES